ncbi:uncharacterized protein LOC111705804 isoform X3 [Eurytemora carolleeae]|uniref:uncharacterized protein LOC111705804 isoform X2 n=1 Tax=Eurytemora carolleeae TaxID=1294199 RepID=UPI000C76FDDA|nr:uncharacterized protein LOC111705804 isoform X2 [Eurytemora carolleeae]XP_023334246.1 uncharacterized protein LOC111705804 isoform X3 [Eurytemora carolleeae]|eukprot:XP_023334245.1 uncharacterized protein LOC111705804 isoform X2 [Eurytemora affinis]
MGKRKKDGSKAEDQIETDSPRRHKKTKEVIISEVSTCKNGKKFPPVFLSFTHAKCNPEQLNKSQPSVDVKMNGCIEGKVQIGITLKTNHIAYTNTDDDQDSHYTTYLAIRDKSTGKTRLIESLNVMMRPELINMQDRPKSVVAPRSTNPLLLKTEVKEVNSEDRIETNKQLIKSFGQRKGQRYYELKELNTVDAEDTEARVLKAAGVVDAGAVTTPVIEAKTTLSLVPPRDEDAGRADMIYRVEHILTEREVQELITACGKIVEKYSSDKAFDKGVEEKIFSPIGAIFLKKLLKNPGEFDHTSALSLYLDAIVKFTKMKPADLKKGLHSLPPHLPLMIKKKIFDQFSTGPEKKRFISPELKDKAVYYSIDV